MLDGYIKLNSGIIEKLEKRRQDNTKDYPAEYNSLGELSNYMAHLRLGFIVGNIGKYPESILDVGYGNGDFLKCCSNIIKQCYGYEISEYPTPKNCIKLKHIDSSFYEVITFFDSLEHFEDLGFVKNLNCKYLCISVPWCHYPSDDWFKNWKHIKPNEHFWHFDKDSLITFMNENNYRFVCGTNLEDLIRKPSSDLPNILTCMFEKIN
jgi:hypothetical protein